MKITNETFLMMVATEFQNKPGFEVRPLEMPRSRLNEFNIYCGVSWFGHLYLTEGLYWEVALSSDGGMWTHFSITDDLRVIPRGALKRDLKSLVKCHILCEIITKVRLKLL